MIYMKTEAYQRVNLSYHEHLPSWVLTFVPTKHGSYLLKSKITVAYSGKSTISLWMLISIVVHVSRIHLDVGQNGRPLMGPQM